MPTKICPLITIASIHPRKCMEEHCAWWDDAAGRCSGGALGYIADALENVSDAIYHVYEDTREKEDPNDIPHLF